MTRALIAILILGSILMHSCKQSFDDDDMLVLNLYSIGDTLIFTTEMGDIDSFRIVNKDIRYSGLSEGYSGNPQMCQIEYQTIPPSQPQLVSFGGPQGDVYSQNNPFLSATKWENDKPASIEIKFGGFNGTIPSKDSLKKDKILGDIFQINDYCNNCSHVDSTDIIQIIWSPNKGIVQYMKKNKTIWRLTK